MTEQIEKEVAREFAQMFGIKATDSFERGIRRAIAAHRRLMRHCSDLTQNSPPPQVTTISPSDFRSEGGARSGAGSNRGDIPKRFRLLRHRCGNRVWIAGDEELHLWAEETDMACSSCRTEPFVWDEVYTFFAIDNGPGLHPTQDPVPKTPCCGAPYTTGYVTNLQDHVAVVSCSACGMHFDASSNAR